MSAPDFKNNFGEEYPVAVTQGDVRMPLQQENRFSRRYHSNEHKTSCVISRFMDNSATITAKELKREWPTWTKELQMDFCQSCSWLFSQDDFPEMLRFILRHGDSDHWSAIALEVARGLPQQEAFDALVRALHCAEIGHASNMLQGIAATKHPLAEAVLRKHLKSLWTHPDLWNNAQFINWIAFETTTCIAHLIELGVPQTDFGEQARQLSQHICQRNRDTCRNFLSKHYPQINFSI